MSNVDGGELVMVEEVELICRQIYILDLTVKHIEVKIKISYLSLFH